MGPTVESIARDVVASVGLEGQYILAVTWISRRYQEIAGIRKLRHLRKLADRTVPETILAGTVTATLGSPLVVGDATAQAAWTAVAPDLDANGHRAIRIATVWYTIIGTQGATLHLSQAYTEPSVVGSGYTLIAKRVPLPADCRFVSIIGHPRLYRILDNLAMFDLETQAITRPRVDAYPEAWAESDPDADGTKTIEIYPYIRTAPELIRLLYYTHPPELHVDDHLPPTIDPIYLREGVLIDAFRKKMALAADIGQTEAAALWRNESRAQESKWQDYMRTIAANDMGADDMSFVLDTMKGRRYPFRDIVTARDQVWSERLL